METLFLIPARGGSKGVPGKNIRLLGEKPLIAYSIDIARQFVADDSICVSSDDPHIISTVEDYGLKVPFRRPAELATDRAGSNEVILHALDYYKANGRIYDRMVLLQPTSPFRKKEHIAQALELYSKDIDMVASVMITDANPYYVLFEENSEGYLQKSKEMAQVLRRQDVPLVYQLNGSVYIVNTSSFRQTESLSKFKRIKKYIMDPLYSQDIDTPLDWAFCEFLLEKKIIKM